MKLSDCTLGKIVCTKDRDGTVGKVGMIVGITNNCDTADYKTRSEPERAIPLVEWSGGGRCGTHPSHLHNY